MNAPHNPKAKPGSFSIGLKAALVISALGLIVTVVDKTHMIPGEVHAAPAAQMAPSAATAEAPTTSYPQLSAAAVSDEDGHPSSF